MMQILDLRDLFISNQDKACSSTKIQLEDNKLGNYAGISKIAEECTDYNVKIHPSIFVTLAILWLLQMQIIYRQQKPHRKLLEWFCYYKGVKGV